MKRGTVSTSSMEVLQNLEADVTIAVHAINAEAIMPSIASI